MFLIFGFEQKSSFVVPVHAPGVRTWGYSDENVKKKKKKFKHYFLSNFVYAITIGDT